jgi:hypothetical protein
MYYLCQRVLFIALKTLQMISQPGYFSMALRGVNRNSQHPKRPIQLTQNHNPLLIR